MQAVVLAAGMGRRLGKLTERSTKFMIPVNGRPLTDALKSAGLKPTTKQAKRASRLLIDDKTVAIIVTTAKGLRVYVKTTKLPAAIKGFAETKGTGYACALNADDDKQLAHVVAAIKHASETNAKGA